VIFYLKRPQISKKPHLYLPTLTIYGNVNYPNWGVFNIFSWLKFVQTYLLKPMYTANLSQTCCIKQDKLFFIRSHKSIPLSEIIMLQANVNYTIFHLKDGKQFMSARSIKLYDLTLEKYGFVRTHRGYLVNTKHLIGYNDEDSSILLSDNHIAPISRRKKGQLIEQF
jgi:DNA-binding LytR/AlgR family response regulator